MRHLTLAAAALLLAGPAFAHHGERHPAPNLMAQANTGDSIQELQRQRRNPDVPPGVQAQRRDAADADAASLDDAASQVRAAATALRAGRAGQANEFLERAESRLLTRSTVPAQAGEPVRGGPVGHIAAARAALFANDRAKAQAEIEAALTALNRPAPARRSRQ
ncbi:hypothetical protein [Sediminicoccus sp. BL-A-41-H5]|jgi:hypothetical protein|uniref:hypothetical protein n=1 Tax=Sediminicoccus sp. BL-A-41-H5 TaxID=3421106 RepID=UPI003D66CF63